MNPAISILIRKLIDYLAVYLVAKGYLQPDQADAWVSANTAIALGLGIGSLGTVLSFLDKLKNSIFKLNGEPKNLSKIQDRIATVEAKK